MHHSRGDLLEALPFYERVVGLNPAYSMAYASIAALYQGLGASKQAISMYEYVIPLLPSDAGVLNNYGALLGTMNQYEESLFWLQKAHEIDPTMLHTLINLGSYYQDDGQSDVAYTMFSTAAALHPKEATLLHLRMSLMLSPVAVSWPSMNAERNDLLRNLTAFLRSDSAPALLDASLDRVPFYVSYHGLNDRVVIERIVAAYHKAIVDLSFVSSSVSPVLRLRSPEETKTSRIRVGFMSKFFGVFEPHGLLLDGVMQYLPRELFEVICLPVARNDGKPLASSVRRAADRVVDLPLSHRMVQDLISRLDLDILVFADVMSEPMNHFLAHSRLAPIQVAFWGNPITSGSGHMDYFVSSDAMEHPYRTRIPYLDEPWTEQVVLIGGQGIWYSRPESPEQQLSSANFSIPLNLEVYDRAYFGLDSAWFLYLCPQSVFKMHPLFDYVFRDILLVASKGHIVVTGGRRASWTRMYHDRLVAVLGPDLAHRLHFISRVSSEKFLGLLDIADVILHPFPFDGSRTSADGLIAGKPVLTLPSEHLRGRMGAAFYRTMNLPELVARNRSEYVRIAVNLCDNATLYAHVSRLIAERLPLVWEDMSVPYEWARFLALAAGARALSWAEFVTASGRSLSAETELRVQRETNARDFATAFGSEWWLLEQGVARLPSVLPADQSPRIFTDWSSAASLDADMSALVAALDYDGAAELGYRQMASCRLEARCLLALGSVQYMRGEYASALHLCDAALALAPSSVAAMSCKGVAGIYLNRPDEAIPALYSALREQGEQSAAGYVLSESTAVLQENLVSALSSFGRHDECVDVLSSLMAMPSALYGGALLLVFSFVAWDPSKKSYLEGLGNLLRDKGQLSIDAHVSLYSEIIRIQSLHAHLLNHGIACYSKTVPADLWTAITSLMLESVQAGSVGLDEKSAMSLSGGAAADRGVVLLVQYYLTDNSATQRDMADALSRNLNNEHIASVFVLAETELDLSAFASPKLQQRVIGERLTFQLAFRFANEYLPNRTVVLANADIYFDETLERVAGAAVDLELKVLALSKWKRVGESLSLSLRTDSQDSWIFRPPLNDSLVAASGFYLGAARCDNRVACLLAQAGYEVSNPVFAIRSIEIHTSEREGSLYSMRGAVKGEGAKVLLSDALSFTHRASPMRVA